MKITSKRNRKFHFSPLRYPGGKTPLFLFFDKIIRENILKRITYIEPFAGGAGVALALLFSGKVERIVINDFNKAIYSFWKAAIFDSERFIEKMNTTPTTIKEWKRQKSIYSNPRSRYFDLGFATFFLNRTNVSGILDGGPIGGMGQNSIWKIDARFNKKSLAEKIQQLSSHKDRISIFNKDGIDLIKDYLGKKNTFVYLDPPYYEKGAALYLNHYKKEDHEALARNLNENPGAFWLLTYDDKREIRSLYSERRVIKFSLNYNAYRPRRGREVLILSDAVVI